MEEFDLKEMMDYFYKKKIIMLIFVIASVILGVIYTNFNVQSMYEASTSIIFTRTDFQDEADVSSYAKMVDRYSVVANSRTVASKVIENLQLNMSISEFKSLVTIVHSPTAYTLRVTVKNTDEGLVKKISDEMAKVFIEEVDRIYNDKELEILDYAIADYVSIDSEMSKNVAIFSLIGTAFICGFVLLCFIFNNKKK